MKFSIRPRNLQVVRAWCIRNIGPEEYYIHTEFGGRNWVIRKNTGTFVNKLIIANDKTATLAALALSEYLS